MPLKSIYGLDFDIFSDEHRSIRNAIEDIIPGLKVECLREVIGALGVLLQKKKDPSGYIF